jgi:hypothetical protein
MTAKLFFMALAFLPIYAIIVRVIGKNARLTKKQVSGFFIYGILSAIPFLLLIKVGITASTLKAYLGLTLTIFTLATLEELSKFSAHRFMAKTENKVALYLIVGLGFAYFENVFYFAKSFDYLTESINNLLIVVFRLILASIAHATFTSITGVIWAFGAKEYLFRFTAILAGSALHYVFNLSCEQNWLSLLPLLLLGGVLLNRYLINLQAQANVTSEPVEPTKASANFNSQARIADWLASQETPIVSKSSAHKSIKNSGQLTKKVKLLKQSKGPKKDQEAKKMINEPPGKKPLISNQQKPKPKEPEREKSKLTKANQSQECKKPEISPPKLEFAEKLALDELTKNYLENYYQPQEIQNALDIARE